jgi:tRNA modification GTPase
LVLENKADLTTNPDLARFLPQQPHLRISAATGTGLPELRDQIRTTMETGLLIPDEEAVLVSARHAEALSKAHHAVLRARNLLAANEPTELAASELHAAIHALGIITGTIDNERMLDQLFAGFCIGK